MVTVPVTLNINQARYDLSVDARQTLLDLLRDRLGLTGTKRGCNQGVCGSCTVLFDGRAVRSCLALAANCGGTAIITVEGLASEGALNPIQKAFVEAGAIQCGFCMPGMVVAATALLNENPSPTVEEVREGLGGNLCRCSGYVKVIEAVLNASRALRGTP